MKILVTGVNGQLGHDVMNELAKRNIEALGCGRALTYKGIRRRYAMETMAYRQLDITNQRQVLKRYRNIILTRSFIVLPGLLSMRQKNRKIFQRFGY